MVSAKRYLRRSNAEFKTKAGKAADMRERRGSMTAVAGSMPVRAQLDADACQEQGSGLNRDSREETFVLNRGPRSRSVQLLTVILISRE